MKLVDYMETVRVVPIGEMSFTVQAWEYVCSLLDDFSWGNNNKTLVYASVLETRLRDMLDDEEDSYGMRDMNEEDVDSLRNALSLIEELTVEYPHAYLDLEN